jgi:hypothetical protein
MGSQKIRGTVKQRSRVLVENVMVQLEEDGRVWRGNFPELGREDFAGADLQVPFGLHLQDGRVGEVNLTFYKKGAIPFEVAFEGFAERKRTLP